MSENTYYSYFLEVPDVAPFNNQVTRFNTWIGNFVRPLLHQMPEYKYWFSRYPDNEWHLRIWTSEDAHNRLAVKIKELMDKFGITFHKNQKIDGLIGVPLVKDLGHRRWLSEENVEGGKTRQERAEQLLAFLHATAELTVASLNERSDHQWEWEITPEANNPLDLHMESVHHLFYKITEMPIPILLGKDPLNGDIWTYSGKCIGTAVGVYNNVKTPVNLFGY